MGGGAERFTSKGRKDKLNLIDSLAKRGYAVVYSQDELSKCESKKIFGLFAEGHLPEASKRGGVMQQYMLKALERLDKNPNGFFMMLEGSRIDMEAHLNKYDAMVEETLDFDRCVAIALDFAKRKGNTLVVVTADHETGGLTLPAKGSKTQDKWTTLNHTGVPVPIYSFGPGAENFTRVMQNTDIFFEIYKLMK